MGTQLYVCRCKKHFGEALPFYSGARFEANECRNMSNLQAPTTKMLKLDLCGYNSIDACFLMMPFDARGILLLFISVNFNICQLRLAKYKNVCRKFHLLQSLKFSKHSLCDWFGEIMETVYVFILSTELMAWFCPAISGGSVLPQMCSVCSVRTLSIFSCHCICKWKIQKLQNAVTHQKS